jgi:putative flavoprotein involved in K+ transport
MAAPGARAVVVGGGPAGLATAACLAREGIGAVVLERAPRIGDHWRQHYDRLHLHTARALSGLPGLPLPRSAGPWVARDDVAAYLEDYAAAYRLDVRTGVEATRVDRDGDGWAVATSGGELLARAVVVAAGHNRVPRLPAWPGRDAFGGEVVHSSAYRSAAPWRGRRVLVAGTGNSGAEIALDLAEGGAREVLLAVRTPPNILPRDVLGLPMQLAGIALGGLPPRVSDPLVRATQRLLVGDLSASGLPRPRRGVASQFRANGTVPVLDVGLVRAVRAGRVTPVAAVERLAPGAVVLADGRSVAVDGVVAATGFEPGLEALAGGLGVLDERGLPRAHGAAPPGAPGLHFVGYKPVIGGPLREIGHEAAAAAREIARRRPAPAPATVAA